MFENNAKKQLESAEKVETEITKLMQRSRTFNAKFLWGGIKLWEGGGDSS